LPAAIVGDLTPDDGISKEEKNRRETAAIEHMCLLLGDTAQGNMLSLSSNIDSFKVDLQQPGYNFELAGQSSLL
jgi:hypothetical protein